MSTAKKTTAPASTRKSKASEPPKSPPKSRAEPEPNVDDAVNVMMQTIDADHFASADVDREETIDFYSQLAQLCEERASSIKNERDTDNDDE